jgi:hypothetical protein
VQQAHHDDLIQLRILPILLSDLSDLLHNLFIRRVVVCAFQTLQSVLLREVELHERKVVVYDRSEDGLRKTRRRGAGGGIL